MVLPTNNEDLVRFLLRHYDRTKDLLADTREMWYKFYKIYHSKQDSSAYPLAFDVFVPLCFAQLETIMPRYMHGLLYRDPLIQVIPEHPITPMRNVRAAGRLLNKWVRHEDQFHDIVMINKEKVMYGTAFGKVVPKQKIRKIKRRMPLYAGLRVVGYQIQEIEVPEINQPWLIHRDLFDIFPSLNESKNSECSIICDRLYKPMSDIEHGEIEYSGIQELKQMGAFRFDEDYLYERMERVGKTYYDSDAPYDPDMDMRQLLEFTVREQTREGEKIWLITIGNRKVLMRKEEIPVWPWIKALENPMQHECFGMSAFYSTAPLNMHINDLLNIQLQNHLMSTSKMWIIDDSAMLDVDQLVSEPGGIIRVANINGIEEVTFGGGNDNATALLASLNQAFQLASGLSDYMQGQTPNRQEFVSTVLTLKSENEAKIDYGIKWSDKNCIIPLGGVMLRQAQEYLSIPAMVNVGTKENPSWEEYSMSDIWGLMGVRMASNASGANELERQSIMQFASALTQILGPDIPIEFRIQMAQELGKTFDGLEGLQDVLEQLLGAATQATAVAGGGAQTPIGAGASAQNPAGMASIAGPTQQTAALSDASNAGINGLESLGSIF